jgi:hypothetical protein
VIRVALRRLDTLRVLAAPAPTVRRAERSAAPRRLGAALFLTPLAASVRLAVRRAAANRRLGAPIVLAALASSMRRAERSAACSSPLGAARQLTLTRGHGTPPNSRCRPNPTAARHSQPSPTPSQSSSPHQCTPDTGHDGGSARARSERWARHAPVEMAHGDWAGDVRRVWSGQDGQGHLRAPRRPVRRLPTRPATFPPAATRPTRPRCKASTARRRDTVGRSCPL